MANQKIHFINNSIDWLIYEDKNMKIGLYDTNFFYNLVSNKKN